MDKVTSRKMFKIEVDIMTDVIKHLNSKGIYVIYVYDALFCELKQYDLVMETMNRIILGHGVKTCVKNGDLVEQEAGAKVLAQPKYALTDTVKLYDVLPLLSYDVEEVYKVIEDFDRQKVQMANLVRYFGKQIREQQYHDYEGVPITNDTIIKLKSMIA